jgi:Fe-S-cluster-containing dehydrogenase component
MGIDRRTFIRIAGVTAAGLATGVSAEVFAEREGEQAAAAAGQRIKRWAMVVDLRKCRQEAGCVDCINACHQAHNVPHFDDPKEEVKWVWKDEFDHAFPDQENEYESEERRKGPALLMCNHCDNPPCVKVCPTEATWKRKSDGIVMMDWHRCIGCRYCMAACPYGSRSFNWRDPRSHIDHINEDFPTRTRGVVEKCTFCEEQLAKGEQPLCVRACKEGALVFGDLDDPESTVREILSKEFALRRKPELGTDPGIYYLV